MAGRLGEWLGARRSELDFEWDLYRLLKAGLGEYQCGGGGGVGLPTGGGESALLGRDSRDGAAHVRALPEGAGAEGATALAAAGGSGSGGADGGDEVCLNLQPVIDEGEDELGPALRVRKGAEQARVGQWVAEDCCSCV